MVAKKNSKKSVKGKPSPLAKKMKKYATKSNAYKALLLAGTLGIVGATVYRKRRKAEEDVIELTNKIPMVIKEIDECYKNLSEMKKSHELRLRGYNEELRERVLVNINKAKQLSQILNSVTKRRGSEQKGGSSAVRVEQELLKHTQKLDECKKLREDQIKEFVQKVHAIQDQIKLAEKLSDKYKFKLMEIMRKQR